MSEISGAIDAIEDIKREIGEAAGRREEILRQRTALSPAVFREEPGAAERAAELNATLFAVNGETDRLHQAMRDAEARRIRAIDEERKQA